ncbi:MAG TPA: ribosomal protein S18-alanine N-acetyltransferase [Usitatibacteraceae bacterium]|nr:ribosomal protein S18-alanine N-acetyltransferase [Usitatibacteraceae bacterium]
MNEQDVNNVASIERDVYVFPWSAGNFRDSLAAGYQCTCAQMDRQLVGYSIVMTALDEAHLLNLAVARAWQGQGIGRRMMEHLIAGARAEKRENFYLEVRPSNIAGRRLYDQLGFRELGLRRGYYPAVGGREDALFLGLRLKAA